MNKSVQEYVDGECIRAVAAGLDQMTPVQLGQVLELLDDVTLTRLHYEADIELNSRALAEDGE